MAVSKLITTDPSSLVGTVDANGIANLSYTGTGNSVVLESIAKTQTVTTAISKTDVGSVSQAYQSAAEAQLTSLKAVIANELDLVSNVGKINITGTIMSSLGETLAGLADTGDVLGMYAIKAAMDSLGFDGMSLLKSLCPDVIGALLSNFNIDTLYPNLSLAGLLGLSSSIGDAIYNMDPEWYWLDKELNIYDYKKLARLSTYSINMLSLYEAYEDIAKLAGGLRDYRINLEL